MQRSALRSCGQVKPEVEAPPPGGIVAALPARVRAGDPQPRLALRRRDHQIADRHDPCQFAVLIDNVQVKKTLQFAAFADRFRVLYQDMDEMLGKVRGRVKQTEAEEKTKSGIYLPDTAIGAMPPFGNLYGLQTFVDKHLAEQEYFVFEAGTHTDGIIISYRDYERLVNPKIEDLSIKLHPMKGA